ncbi:MAG: 3-deoxy-8-phosphooctulonate synthase [Puniceicoccales bacterium]|jgi:2-dehydro-3-deoxyphosphooctonate aldolase (KDO 8-P synthase)|nr:3-deoxy-8-phosphooctulonate synthase [Puniceicoccales bacterium]
MHPSLFNPSKLLLIAGPCALESSHIAHEVATTLRRIQDQNEKTLQVIFKASFDKANRTHINNPRGVGIEQGLEILADIKSTYRFPVLTDIHLPEQAAKVAPICDVIQIPAFLCRQTDLLIAAAQSNRTVNIKKGQFLSPADMQFVVGKLKTLNAVEIWQTERGTSFGYGNLVVDMRTFPILKENACPVIFDATHSLQMPGLGVGHTSGDRRYAVPLAKAALAAGAQGIFIETHPNPANALSDQATQIPLENFHTLLESCLDLWRYLNKNLENNVDI